LKNVADSTTSARQIDIQGIGVSPGVVRAPAFLLTTEEDRVVERDIAEEEIAREVARFEEALIDTRHQLHEIQRQVGDAIGQESASIFDAHLLVVDDRSLVEEVIRGLGVYRKNVEAVLRVVSERYAQALLKVEDDYLRERAADVKDVTRRILRNLSGGPTSSLAKLEHPCVLVANDLAPSEAAVLDKAKVIGFATDLGSPTSHTAIMARALGIPAVVGLHDVSIRVRTGDEVVVDGNKGLFIIRPTAELLERYGKVEAARRTIRTELETLRMMPAETLDGYRVLLSANIELPTDIDAVLANGAYGVGLFRTEYLYLSSPDLPDEERQVRAYEEIARRLGEAPAIIRTLDLGGDKFLSHVKTPREMNPFMGWRAIRFCLAQPEIFKTQLRAILRASRYGNVKIMYPMISDVDELVKANELLAACKQELRAAKVEFNPEIEVGAMIEVPSAALTANLLAPHVDFFSLGTNDLVQYTMAVDRVNERIAYLYKPTHPAILSLIKQTIDVGHDQGIWTGICGEMAGNPLMVPLLIGLGVDEISVSPIAVPLVKDVIRKIRYSQAEALANSILASETPTDVAERCRQLIQTTAPEVLELVG
jgi:phosphoenolpyruvate-protein phosphotransferase (PTS system enzyme I)